MDDKQKILNAIGMGVRSNNIAYGQRMIEQVRASRVYLVIITKEMGESQRKKVLDKCKFYNVKVLEDIITSEELNKVVNKEKKISAIGITDINLSKLIKSYI